MSREVPSEWKLRNLSELIYLTPGWPFKSNRFTQDPNEGRPLVRIRDLGDQAPAMFTPEECDDRYLIGNGDYLIGMDGEFIAVKWLAPAALLNQRVLKIGSAHPDLDDSFLFYRIQPELADIEARTGATTVKHLSTKDISSLQLYLPPLHEQRRIAEILSSVDEAIAATRAVIEQTKRVKHGVLERLLAKGIGHTRFKQTDIGEIPVGWEVATLGDVVSDPDGLQTGPFGSQLKAEEYVKDGIPVVMPRDLIAGQISTRQISRVTPAKVSQLHMHVLHAGDIVFARRGDIGRFALASTQDEGFICGTGCLRARLNVEKVLPAFASAFLESEFAKEWLNNNAVGQTMLNLNTSIISRLPFTLPPLGEQARMVEAVNSFGASQPSAEKCLSQLYTVKSALMSNLLTGRKRVTDALPMAAE